MAPITNPEFAKSVSSISGGFFKLAVVMAIVGIVAVLIGKKHGGKTQRQRKATADLIWAFGLILIGVFLIPRLFGHS